MGVKQVYPGRYVPEQLIALARKEGVTFSHGVPTLLQMILGAAGKATRFEGWKWSWAAPLCRPHYAPKRLPAASTFLLATACQKLARF